jgi:hypothetical protein
MMLRQEAALDRSIDRKVRILMRLRKESSNLPSAPPGQDDGTKTENIERVLDRDISSRIFQGAEMMESLRMNEQSRNVYENKGPAFRRLGRSGDSVENKGGYA